MTTTTTVLTEDGAVAVDATLVDDRVVIEVEKLAETIGWTLEPEGLCRGSVCVPVPDRSTIEAGDGVDLASVARTLGSTVLVAADEAMVAIGVPAPRRSEALVGRQAPDFELPDLDGTLRRLSDWDGRRRLLVAFATW